MTTLLVTPGMQCTPVDASNASKSDKIVLQLVENFKDFSKKAKTEECVYLQMLAGRSRPYR